MRVPVSRTFAISVAGVTAASLLCLVALARALTVEPVAPAAPVMLGVASGAEIDADDAPPARVPSEGVLDREALALAVDHDPFMPDRRRAAPYRLPGETVERPVVVRSEEPDPPPFRVIGTAQIGDAGIALVEVENSPAPEVVKVGESLFGYRLQRVETEAATMVGQGQTVRLAVERGEIEPQRGSNDRNNRNSRNNRNTEQQLDRARAVLEQLRERGLPIQMIGQIMSQQFRSIRGSSFGVVETDGGNRVIIRTRPDTSRIELSYSPEPQ
jgi:hypothetical protein